MTANDLRILVVDDSPVMRKIIRRELEPCGYQLAEAVDGHDALTKAAAFSPDLITLDVDMPKLNGFETCGKLREKEYERYFTRSPENRVPVIFVTANDKREDRNKGFDLGAMDFISKPFDRGALLKAVNKILRPDERLGELTALVVRGNRDYRRLISISLQREGVTTVEVEDGNQAYKIVDQTPDRFDIIIFDLAVPGMSGESFCKKIRNELNLKEIPIIILPLVEDQVELFELFKAGATDYLVQPFVKEELLARLMVHLERVRLNKSLHHTLAKVQDFNKALEAAIKSLTHIGASLTSEKDLNKLLEMVVVEAQQATHSDGGTLYMLRDNQLHFEILRNTTLKSYMGGATGNKVSFPPVKMAKSNVSAYCALTRTIVNIPDVYSNSKFDFSGPKKFDEAMGYQTKSMLVLPMLDRDNEVVGVLQLINSIDPATGQIIEFSKEAVDIANSLSCQAAVCIENAMSYEKIKRKNIAFERFVPNEFLRFLNKNEIEEIELGEAAEADLSVLFSDIRSFTNISEQMTPEQNFRFLNSYLDRIGPVIEQNKGFIDKYIGDAIMALFGGNHSSGAQDAVTASVEIQKTIKVYNTHRGNSGYPAISIGVGINTGKMILGTIGFESRMESTVIGDTVNLASRLEGLTKQYGIPIAISSFTLNALENPEAFLLREIDTVQVKGKQEAVTVYEVFDSNESEIRDAKQQTLKRYNEGLFLFRQSRWREAHMLFTELMEKLVGDRVIKIYEKKCRFFSENPPGNHEMLITRLEHK